MEFELAENSRVGWLTIGGVVFSIDTPGPYEIQTSEITQEQRAQLLYNSRRGALSCSDLPALVEETEGMATPTYVAPAEIPLGKPHMPDEDPLKEDLKALKAILKKSVGSIKKELPSLSVGRTRKLLELETEGKNRKGLRAVLEEQMSMHLKGVADAVGAEEVESQFTTHAVDPQASANVTDVVESKMEQVVLNPAEKE